MKRHEAREKAMQTLFQLDSTEMSPEEAMTHIVGEEQDPFYAQLVNGTFDNRSEIDESLRTKLEKWTLDRLPKVERTVLRMAVYELQYMEETPAKVVLNEAIELCKTFGDENSGRFVNGVLSKYND
ncbi:transcription antitermination factor NusB [Edaphobacillus lindanitolerans]|nr:transcription antitermination factor NusB [Edaphobacillus lindanitolerans]